MKTVISKFLLRLDVYKALTTKKVPTDNGSRPLKQGNTFLMSFLHLNAELYAPRLILSKSV